MTRQPSSAAARPAVASDDERFALAAEAAGLGSWQLDLETRELTASDQCKANHGLPPSSGLSLERDVIGTIDEPARPGFVKAIGDARKAGDEFQAEVPNTWPDGTHHWLLIRGRVIAGNRMVGVTMDVTERRQMEDALRDADRRKDDFLAILGHELRNPLAAILAAAKFLEMTGPDDPKLRRARETIVRQASQVTKIVDDLMDVGRINAGKLDIERKDISLASVITQAVEACGPSVNRRRHVLNVSMPERDVRLTGDLTRLVQALCNLLNNASKYMDEGGVIDLSARVEGADAVINVRDQGVGISPDMLDVIFQRFVQIGSSRYASEGGLGLGLSLVKAIVEMHGGRVEARSAGIGRGAEFIIRLPAA